MNTLTRGGENVQKLMEALGGPVPKEAECKSQVSLLNIVRERVIKEQQRRAEFAKLQLQAQAPFMAIFQEYHKPEEVQKFRDLAEPELKAFCPPRPAGFPKRFPVEPRFQIGSNAVIKGPPYDTSFTENFSVGGFVWIDAPRDGICGFSISGQGTTGWAALGWGTWFWSITDNPLSRLSAYLDYLCFNWTNCSLWYPGYSEASVNLSVWGAREDDWIIQQSSFYPNWKDTAYGVFACHGDSQQGLANLIQTYFPTLSNSWYLVWVWTYGLVEDYRGSGFGFSVANASMDMYVPYVAFEP